MEEAPGQVPEAGDLSQLTGGSGGHWSMARPLQPRQTPLALGLPATCTCHPADHRTPATHTSPYAVVSLDLVQKPRQVRGARAICSERQLGTLSHAGRSPLWQKWSQPISLNGSAQTGHDQN
jgi:hypothetical protein